MVRVSSMGAFVLLLFVASHAAQAAEKNCTLKEFPSLPISFDSSGGVTVPVTIDGHKVHLLIDTGGDFSLFSRSSASRLGLEPHDLPFGVYLTAWGGLDLDQYILAKTITIAGMQAKDKQMALVPDYIMSPGDDGTLGEEVLKYFDVDFDFSDGKFNLFSQKHCKGMVVYWTNNPYAKIPFRIDHSRSIRLEVQLDGKDVSAMIDTGTSQSVMSREVAADLFHLTRADMKTSDGHYPFKFLKFHGVTVSNPDIVLVPDDKSQILDRVREPAMIIGMGILRQLHMYIAFKERNIYVTPADAH